MHRNQVGQKSASRKEIVSKIKEITEGDARFTVRDIARKVGISLSTVHFILKKHLKVRKISARWVPHLLTDEQKRQRVKVAKKLLQMFPKYDKKQFANVVTGDETWVHYFEPVRKVSNKIWATKHSKRPIIAKRSLSTKKVLYAIFFSGEGVAIKVPVKKGKGITGKYYKDVVLKKLKKYYQKRRPATGFKHVRLLHDNAPAHTSAIVTAFLKKEKVTVLPHPPYSPDLAPCDFFLFPKLKAFLAGRKYQSQQALGSAIHQYLITVPKSAYRDAFKKWIHRLKILVFVYYDSIVNLSKNNQFQKHSSTNMIIYGTTLLLECVYQRQSICLADTLGSDVGVKSFLCLICPLWTVVCTTKGECELRKQAYIMSRNLANLQWFRS